MSYIISKHDERGIPCQVVPPSAGPDSDFDNFWYTLRSICADLKNKKKENFRPPRKK